MAERQLSEDFALALTSCQNRLYGYIFALVYDPHEAEDLLQETNAVLCRKAAELPQIKDFTGWACRIAYRLVLARRKEKGRDRLVFDQKLLDLLAQDAMPLVLQANQYQAALHDCLADLPESQRILIMQRYDSQYTMERLSAESQRPIASLHQSLYRIRAALLRCIERRVAREEHAV